MTTPSSALPQGVRENFDTGPLSWVMVEIREALTRSKTALFEAAAQESDSQSTSLRHAKSFLHQAHGALQIVDIDGVAIITETVEDLLDRFDAGQLVLTQESAQVIATAYQALTEYLEELLSGGQHQPVRLFPYYRALLEVRGAERIHPADLFFPNLAIRPSVPAADPATGPAVGYTVLRQRFEKALLPFIKAKGEAEQINAGFMRDIINEVERVQTNQQSRAFWWVMHGFADAVSAGQVPNELYVKQLFARINLQIRRLSEGSASIAERLLRDALFFIARVENPSLRVSQIRRAYQLDGLVPVDYEKKRYGQIDVEALVIAKERLSQAKNVWNRIAGGDVSVAPSFEQQMNGLTEAGAKLNSAPLLKLLRELNGIARHAAHSSTDNGLAIELATSLLFVESALNQINHLPENFAERADAMTARLLSIVSGEQPTHQAQWLDDMSREAQEKQTMTALGGEMQSSLRQVEKMLDEYFRDPSQRAGLTDIDKTLHQIEGGLAILDQDDAVRAVRHTQAAVKRFAEQEGEPPSQEEFQHVARNVGALSFFIESLQLRSEGGKKRYSFDDETGVFHANIIEKNVVPAVASIDEVPLDPEPAPVPTAPRAEAAPAPASQPAMAEPVRAAPAQSQPAEARPAASKELNTVEEELLYHQQQSAELAKSLTAEPDNTVLQEQLKESLEQVRRDAKLVDQPEVTERAQAAIAILAQPDFAASQSAMAEIVSATAPAAALAPSPVAVTPAAPDSDEAVDAELLEIFLTEAEEVLACVTQTVPESRSEPYNQDHLTTLRRSFHTLKGSGRMVGLMAFGEAAWGIEQVLNLRLSETRAGDADLYMLLDKAVEVLGAWVEDLQSKGRSDRTPKPLVRAAERIRLGGSFLYEEDTAPVAAPVVTEIPAEVPAPVIPQPVAPEAVVASAAEPVAAKLHETEPQVLDPLLAEPVPAEVGTDEAAAALNLDGHLAEPEILPEITLLQDAELPPLAATGQDQQDDFDLPAALPPVEEVMLSDAEMAAMLGEVGGAAEPVAESVADAAAVSEPDFLPVSLGDLTTESPAEPETATEPELEPVASIAPAAQIIDFPLTPEVKRDDNVKQIGDIEISVPLHNIYLAETDELVRLLSHDISEWRHEADRHVNTLSVHAAHSLAGSSATVGFMALQEVAHGLEMVLQNLSRKPTRLTTQEYDTLEHSIERIRFMLQMFALGEMPDHEPQQVQILADLLRDILARTDSPMSGASVFPASGFYAESAGAHLHPHQVPADIAPLVEPVEPAAAEAPSPQIPEYDPLFAEPLPASLEDAEAFFAFKPEQAIELAADADAVTADLPAVIAESQAEAFGEPEQELLQELAQPAEQGQTAEPVVSELPDVLDLAEAAQAQSFMSQEPQGEVQAPEAQGLPEPETVLGAEPAIAEPASAQAEPLFAEPEPEPDVAATPLPGAPEIRAESAATTPSAPQFAEPAAARPDEAVAAADVHHIKDELDADLLPVFLEEGRDMLPQMGESLRAWQQRPTDGKLPQSLLRLLHTVKGSARMAGAMSLGQHMHEMETRIEQITRTGAPSAQALEDLLANYDHGLYLFEVLQNPQAAKPVAPPKPLAEQARSPAGTESAAPAPREMVVLSSVMPTRTGTFAAPVKSTAPATPVPLVRVRADILDRLVNQAGEVSISRSKLETEVGTLRQSLSELTENVARLRDQLREIEIQAETQITSRMAHSADREFDPLEFDRFTRLQELTRMMAESVNDVGSVQQNLARTVDNASNDLTTQARLTRDLQQDLMRVRMVQFASISERLYRVTRQASKEVEKRVNLDIRGSTVEIDRGVLEKMAGPFEHLLRNAIVHGIETRAERQAAGKSEIGELLVEIRQEGNEVVILFSDDGRGLNLDTIRSKALKTGLLAAGQEVSDAEVTDLIFQPGFSTTEEVTELAGRGVGMDVVRSEAAALGGRVAIVSETGKGAHFTIHLPLTLAVTQVVVLTTGGKTYAIPSVLVEQVQQLKTNPLAAAYNDGAVMWQGSRVPMFYLSTLLGDTGATAVAQQYSPLMILKSGNDRVAVHVDEILGNREVVVKNIGPQLARLIGIAGATVLGSGEIVLILNPVPLAQRAGHESQRAPRITQSDAPDTMGAVAEIPTAELEAANSEPVAVQGLRTQHIVMVVDDSLTVRRVTQRLLAREGYQVVLAKDGVDALEHLQSITPDVMLVDIEMPRMDGFDLTRNVRNDERTRHIPIIMITSRTATKHRNYAMELGVNEYLGKPYQEDALLKSVAGFVNKETVIN